MRARLTLAILAALPGAACAVEVDGRVDAAEWAGAQHVTDFRMTQPLSRAPASQPTEAWIKATPEGLAVAFRSLQDTSVPRRRERAQRDQGGPMDRVNLYVDFDGDGRNGYNFTLLLSGSIVDGTITSENHFNSDWDGPWRHAVTEDAAGWSAEMLIPWSIAPMQQRSGSTRTIAVALDRVLGATGERDSWPAVSFTEPRFLSVLQKIKVPKYSQSLLAVTPYSSAVFDNVRHRSGFDAGADLFWKPSGQFQVSATLNPDFGQVESDELVVNFGTVETFFSDKRPFFTENQSFFDVPFGSQRESSRLVYTRRVGANRDDGQGAGDVRAAAKVNGSVGGFNYGLFVANEGDDVGRDFYAMRATRDFAQQGFGALVTRVQHPFLDRTATVTALDHRWTPNAAWSVRTSLVASDIAHGGHDSRDSGAQVRVDHELGGGWREQVFALHLGGGLQLNDFGYLERNNFNYGRYELSKRVTDLPAASPFTSHFWRGAVSHRANDDGVFLADAWSLNRSSERRDGGNQFFEVAGFTPGHDDRVTRGHGVVRMPGKLYVFGERDIPRRDRWGLNVNARYAAEDLGGWARGSVSMQLTPSYKLSDSASLAFELSAEHAPGRLLWRADATGTPRLATYRMDQLAANAGATWLIDARQELRVRLEAIGLNADAKQSYLLAADGTPVPTGVQHPDFALRNLGFQVRYRYELAPLSYLYIAYVRGGSFYEQGVDGEFRASDEFRDAFELRDSEQFLVKLSYRFEI